MAAAHQLRIGTGVAQFPQDAHIAAAALADPAWNAGDALLNFMMYNDLGADGLPLATGLPSTRLTPSLIWVPAAAGENGRWYLTPQESTGIGLNGWGTNGNGTPTPGYLNLRAQVKREMPQTGVWVYQRAYAITTAASSRPILTTLSISPCICVVVYKPNTQVPNLPSNAVAALAHFDKDQNFDSLKEILDLPDFAHGDVQIHFYGGLVGDQRSIIPLRGLLNAVYDHNKSHGRFIISAFDVMKVIHGSDFSFDVRTGAKYAFSRTFGDWQGFLLDSLWRFWPNGQYKAILDSSGLGVEANALNDNDTKVKLARTRLQWNGASGSQDFWDRSNELICGLIMNEVCNTDTAKATLSSNDQIATIKNFLILQKMPMSFEQGLKTWIKWKDLNAKANKTDDEKTRLPAAWDKADTSIVGVIVKVCTKKQPSKLDFFAAIQTWYPVNQVPYERPFP